jgi:hypothetical protein
MKVCTILQEEVGYLELVSYIRQTEVRTLLPNSVFAKCVMQNTGVPRDASTCSVKKIEKPKKSRVFKIKFEFSIFDRSFRYCSYKNFYKNVSLVTNTSCCGDFYLINEGAQNTCGP